MTIRILNNGRRNGRFCGGKPEEKQKKPDGEKEKEIETVFEVGFHDTRDMGVFVFEGVTLITIRPRRLWN